MSFHRPVRRYVLFLLLGAGIALACGPEFPYLSILENRSTARFDPPMHSFSGTVQRLVPIENTAFHVDEHNSDAADWEQENLPAEQRQRVTTMREQVSAEAAFKVGEGLPLAIRHYVAGATAYRKHTEEAAASSAADARRHFEAVLALPDPEGRIRAAWAAWGLGRLDRLAGVHDDAIRRFKLVRQLVAAGADDPLGLAVASYGEEAAVHLSRGAVGEAVRLYAIQAAHGSESARNSLLRVAPRVLDDTLKDPLLQSLALAYALEIDEEEVFDDGELHSSNDDIESDSVASSEEIDPAVDETEYEGDTAVESAAVPAHRPVPVLLRVLDRVSALPDNAIADPEAVAVAAYRAARYDIADMQARNAIARGPAPLAFVIRAKLALRRGDMSAVAGYYSEAVTALKTVVPAATATAARDQRDTLSRTLAEWAAFAVNQGIYEEALHRFLDVGPTAWIDAVYLAENVLTADELKAAVDARTDTPETTRSLWREAWQSGGDAYLEESAEDDAAPGDDNERLLHPCPVATACMEVPIRDVLARRLMREGRIDEAIPYFSARRSSFNSSERDDSVREQALDYQRWRKRASSGWIDAYRARSMFKAAELEREEGLELFGYEGAPDGAMIDGVFPPTEIFPERSTVEGAGPDEAARVRSNKPAFPHRFHYRFMAAKTAEAAADLLPRRSQAYAAVLCQATRWVIDGDSDRAGQLYRRYLSEGAYVRWGKQFGRQCPAPDFNRAARTELLSNLQARFPSMTRHPLRTAAGGLAVSVVLIALLIFAMFRIFALKAGMRSER